MDREFWTEDYLNKRRLRNRDNTDESMYNCGGYALGCYSWYWPADYDAYYFGESEDRDDTETADDYYDMVTDVCVANILNDFPDLIKIQSIHEVSVSTEVIAFRIGVEYDDFHFMLRQNGKWTHKMGWGAVEPVDPGEALDEMDWFQTYFGKLILFARKGE